MYCSLNNVENWSKEVRCPSGRLMNQSNAVLENVLINNLQYMASVPPQIIIWVWKAVIWTSGSSMPLKPIFGPMKLAGIIVSMISCENGMRQALTGIGGFHSSVERSPMRCKSLYNSSLALRCCLLLACDAAKSFWYRFWLASCSA